MSSYYAEAFIVCLSVHNSQEPVFFLKHQSNTVIANSLHQNCAQVEVIFVIFTSLCNTAKQ